MNLDDPQAKEAREAARLQEFIRAVRRVHGEAVATAAATGAVQIRSRARELGVEYPVSPEDTIRRVLALIIGVQAVDGRCEVPGCSEDAARVSILTHVGRCDCAPPPAAPHGHVSIGPIALCVPHFEEGQTDSTKIGRAITGESEPVLYVPGGVH